MKHELVGNTLVGTREGVIARCTCGWSSGYRFSPMVASAIFQQHLEDTEKGEPPYPDYPRINP